MRGLTLLAALFAWIAASTALRGEAPLVIGPEPEPFIDRRLISSLRGLELRLHPPDRRETVFRFDAPWEGPESGYVTMLRDGTRYRMFYRGGGERTREVTCLAESEDGVAFTRPHLGLHAFGGSTRNNIVLAPERKSYAEAHNFTPFIDANPRAPASERYKAVALQVLPDPVTGECRKMLVAFKSPDGLRWARLPESPIQTEGSFDSQNVAFYDVPNGRYVCYSRGGRNGVRSILRSTSADFRRWTRPEWIDLVPGGPEQLYTNAIVPYPRNPRLLVGFPMRFVPERRALGADRRPVDALSDAVMISSRDGLHWDRTFREAFLRPGPDPANWGAGHSNNTPAWGLHVSGEREMSLYWSEGCADLPRLRRGTVRLDGLGSVHAGADEGEMLTRPFRWSGPPALNFATSAAGSIRVEALDEAGRPLPGRALADCIELYGDELGRVVEWSPAAPPIAEGRPVRLRVVMREADLYALSVRRSGLP